MKAGTTLHTKVVGVTHRNDSGDKIQEILESMSGYAYEGESLYLEHEKDNPFDENAIKVFYDNEHIGYINRELAAEIAPLVDQERVEAELCEITGGDERSYGCNILLRALPEGTRVEREDTYHAPIHISSTTSHTSEPSPTTIETSSQKPKPKKIWPYVFAAVVIGLWLMVFILYFATRSTDQEGPASNNMSQTTSSSSLDQATEQELQAAAELNQANQESAVALVSQYFPAESVSKVKATENNVEVTITDMTNDGLSQAEQSAQQISTALIEELGLPNSVVYLQDSAGNILLTVMNGKTTYNASGDNTPAEGPNPSTITLEEFNAVQSGMNYQEVFDIIGGRGTLLSEVDMGLGSEYYTAMYQWDGEGAVGANATVTFQGGVVASKAQFGLE